MPHASRTVRILKPIEEVFAFLTDPANERRWRTDVRSFEPEGTPGLGTVVRQKVAGPGGMALKADFRITAFERPTLYAFQVIAGPARPAGEYRLTPVDGGTDLSFTLGAELTGLRARLMGKPVQQSMDNEVAALDRLKALLEQG